MPKMFKILVVSICFARDCKEESIASSLLIEELPVSSKELLAIILFCMRF